MQSGIAEWYNKTGKPILTKSFLHHDTNDTSELEREEAKAFFLNLIQESETFTIALAQVMGQKMLNFQVEMMKMMPVMPGAEKPDFKKIEKTATNELEKALAAQKKDYANRVENYKKNKAIYDQRAFRVLDTNGDGKIKLGEFLDAFSPTANKFNELMVALNFMTETENLQAEKMNRICRGGG